VICRMWRGWTKPEDADAYDDYLQRELFPQVERDLAPRGFRGFHLLRKANGQEVEFVTMLWFDSLAAVQSFAGETCETPVISPKAHSLLSRFAERAEHYELSGSNWQGLSGSPLQA
jgi:heme-degrading monooxygenase HmoA